MNKTLNLSHRLYKETSPRLSITDISNLIFNVMWTMSRRCYNLTDVYSQLLWWNILLHFLTKDKSLSVLGLWSYFRRDTLYLCTYLHIQHSNPGHLDYSQLAVADQRKHYNTHFGCKGNKSLMFLHHWLDIWRSIFIIPHTGQIAFWCICLFEGPKCIYG